MTKRVLVYIVAGIGILAAYFILINLKRVSGIFSSVSGILRPFIIAAIFAYIVNGPMMFFERLFGRLTDKKKPRPVLKRVLAIIAAWMASLAVLVLFFVIIVPDVKISITTLINNLPSYFESLKAFIVALAEKYQLDISYLNSFINFIYFYCLINLSNKVIKVRNNKL